MANDTQDNESQKDAFAGNRANAELVYNAALQQAGNQGVLIWMAFAAFITVNAGLLALAVALLRTHYAVHIAIAALGVAFCLAWRGCLHRHSQYYHFCYEWIRLAEKAVIGNEKFCFITQGKKFAEGKKWNLGNGEGKARASGSKWFKIRFLIFCTIILTILVYAFLLVLSVVLHVTGEEDAATQPQAAHEPKLTMTEKPTFQWRTVKRVIDGVTVELENGERVRLIGVDCPETDEPFGKEAAEFTRYQVEGKKVWLEYDQTKKDKYDRTLAYVHCMVKRTYMHPFAGFEKPIARIEEEQGVLNEEIIRQGYGHAYTKYPFKYMKWYRALEKETREAGRGLWAQQDQQEVDEAPDTPAKPKSHDVIRLAQRGSVMIISVVISGSYTKTEIIDICRQVRDKFARDRPVEIGLYDSEEAVVAGKSIGTYTSKGLEENIKGPWEH